mgnify:CR=1 FL=1
MGKSIIYNNPSGDKALENVYKTLKKNPKALDSSGMGDRQSVETLHLEKAQVPKGTTKKPKVAKRLKGYKGQGPNNVA